MVGCGTRAVFIRSSNGGVGTSRQIAKHELSKAGRSGPQWIGNLIWQPNSGRGLV